MAAFYIVAPVVSGYYIMQWTNKIAERNTGVYQDGSNQQVWWNDYIVAVVESSNLLFSTGLQLVRLRVPPTDLLRKFVRFCKQNIYCLDRWWLRDCLSFAFQQMSLRSAIKFGRKCCVVPSISRLSSLSLYDFCMYVCSMFGHNAAAEMYQTIIIIRWDYLVVMSMEKEETTNTKHQPKRKTPNAKRQTYNY